MTRSLALAALGLVGLASLAFAGEPAPAPAPTAPSEDALKELGRRLFFDPAVSRVGMRSCADCHDPARGYSDPKKRSDDDVGPTRRHAQTLVETAAISAGHWDGEFERIEDVVRSRLSVEITPSGGAKYPTQSAREESDARKAKDPGLLAAEARPEIPDVALAGEPRPAVEVLPALGADPVPADATLPGFVDRRAAADLPDAAARVSAAGRYAEAFEAAFGSKDVTLDRIASALQRYCRAIVGSESAYDRFEAGDQTAISDAAQQGSNLWCEQCASCHPMTGSRPTFTDGRFHNTGVSWRAHAADDRGGEGDLGAGRITHRIAHFRAFKTPTLRDVARRGPYMHDGSLPTLEAVVRRYAEGPPADPRIDPAFPKIDASGTNVADLVAFLESLTSGRRPGLAPTAWARRAETTRLLFVDAKGAPLAGLKVDVVPAGDVLPGFAAGDAKATSLTTDEGGAIRFAPPRATHVRLLVEGGVVPAGGDLVPDTCREATVTVPVAGVVRVKVRVPKGGVAPESFTASRPEAKVFPGRRPVLTVFARRATEPGQDGASVVVYEAPFRTDVGPAAELRLPGSPRVTLDPAADPVVTLP